MYLSQQVGGSSWTVWGVGGSEGAGQPNPEAGSWGRPDPRPAPSARHLQEGLEPPLRARRRSFPPSRSSHACRPRPRSTAVPDPRPPGSPSAPPGSEARGGAAARIGRVAPTETPGGWDGGERAPAEMRWGGSSEGRPRSVARGAVHAVAGERASPRVRTRAARVGWRPRPASGGQGSPAAGAPGLLL